MRLNRRASAPSILDADGVSSSVHTAVPRLKDNAAGKHKYIVNILTKISTVFMTQQCNAVVQFSYSLKTQRGLSLWTGNKRWQCWQCCVDVYHHVYHLLIENLLSHLHSKMCFCLCLRFRKCLSQTTLTWICPKCFLARTMSAHFKNIWDSMRELHCLDHK